MRRPKWGDTVRVNDDVPPMMRPGCLASVCGMREIETAEQAGQFGCAIGTVVFLVEFGDGSSLEIPGAFLDVEDDGAEGTED